MQRIKNLFLAFAATFSFAVAPVLMPAVAHAAIKEQIIAGCDVVDAGCKAGDKTGADTIKPIIQQVTNFLAYAIGALAIFMVIYGGFKYMMSGGDSGKVTESKNTILYALLGLAVVIFAKTLVGFAIGAASQ